LCSCGLRYGHGKSSGVGLRVVAVLWVARPVVEVGPLVAAAGDRGGSVVEPQGCPYEDHRVVLRARLQVPVRRSRCTFGALDHELNIHSGLGNGRLKMSTCR